MQRTFLHNDMPEKSGPPGTMVQPDESLVNRDAIRPYPWPRARYNEYLNNRTYVYGMAVNFNYGNADADEHHGIYHIDPRPAVTVQNLIVPRSQNTD